MDRKHVMLYIHMFRGMTASLGENFGFPSIFSVVEENKPGYLGLNEASKKTKCIYFHCVKTVRIWEFFWSLFSRIRTKYEDLQSKSP